MKSFDASTAARPFPESTKGATSFPVEGSVATWGSPRESSLTTHAGAPKLCPERTWAGSRSESLRPVTTFPRIDEPVETWAAWSSLLPKLRRFVTSCGFWLMMSAAALQTCATCG